MTMTKYTVCQEDMEFAERDHTTKNVIVVKHDTP